MILQRTGIIVGVWCHSIFKGVQIVIDPLHYLQQTMRLTATKNILYFRLFFIFCLFVAVWPFCAPWAYCYIISGAGVVSGTQGWEFAHLISKRIARILSKNERFAHISHFLWATWASHSWSLIFVERNGRFAHIAHLIWAKWAIHSHRSPKKRKWSKMSDLLMFFKLKKKLK